MNLLAFPWCKNHMIESVLHCDYFQEVCQHIITWERSKCISSFKQTYLVDQFSNEITLMLLDALQSLVQEITTEHLPVEQTVLVNYCYYSDFNYHCIPSKIALCHT